MKCPNCKATLLPNESVCTCCNYDSEEKQTPSVARQQRQKNVNEKFCSECGAIIKALAEICPHCGVRQRRAKTAKSNSEKDKFIAGLLALFLGCLGIHHFYLGSQKPGLIYLLTSVLGSFLVVPLFVIAVLSVIDAIKLFMMSSEDFNEKYNNQ